MASPSIVECGYAGRVRGAVAWLVAAIGLLAGGSPAQAQWMLYVENAGETEIRVAVARANGPRRDQISGWSHLKPGRKAAFGSLGGIGGTPSFYVAVAQFTPDGKLGMANYAPGDERILLNGWKLAPTQATFPINPFSDFTYTVKQDEREDLSKQFPHLQQTRFSFYCYGGAQNTDTIIQVPSRANAVITPFKVTAPWQQAVMDAEVAQWAMDAQRRKDNRQPPATSDLAVNRQDYWEAYQKGKVTDELRRAYFGALAAKDFHNVMLRLTTQKGTVQRDLTKLLAPGDLAINPAARVAFFKWMEAVEGRIDAKLRAGGKVDPLKAIDEALAESSDEQAAYVLERNWSEFDLAGVALSPEEYVWMLVTRFPKPKPAAEAQKLLTGLFETFGEANVRAVAEKLRTAPINDKGRLTNPEAFGITPTRGKFDSRGNLLPENKDPCPPGIEAIDGAGNRWRAFRYGLFNTLPQGFALRVILDDVAYDGVDTSMARKVLNRMEIAYGKPAVDAAFDKLRNAPKAMGGGLVDPSAFNGSRYRTMHGSLKHELTRDQVGYARWLIASKEEIDDKDTLDGAWVELVKQHGEEKAKAAIRSVVELGNTPTDQRPAELVSYRGTDEDAYAQFKRIVSSAQAPTAVADNLVTPRDYAEWSRWDVGTSVTVTTVMKSSMNGRQMQQDLNVHDTFKLQDLQSDRLILYNTGSNRKGAGPGDELHVMARKRDDLPHYQGQALLGRTGEIALPASMNVTPAEETLTIAGKQVRCKKFHRRWRTSAPNDRGTATRVVEHEWAVWLSDDVPGTFVRSYESRRQQLQSPSGSFPPSINITEKAVSDFKAPGPPSPPPKRAFILPPDAGSKPLPQDRDGYGPVTTEELSVAGGAAQAPQGAKTGGAPPVQPKPPTPTRGGGLRNNPKGDPEPEPQRGPKRGGPQRIAPPSDPPAESAPQPDPVPAGAKFCTSCGNPLTAGAKFCTACGAKLASPPSPTAK